MSRPRIGQKRCRHSFRSASPEAGCSCALLRRQGLVIGLTWFQVEVAVRRRHCGELFGNAVPHSIIRMTNYFSNAFFHKRISDSFIASQEEPVGKIVATVKCEDLREVVAQDSFLVRSCRRRLQNYPCFSKVANSPARSVLLIGSPLV